MTDTIRALRATDQLAALLDSGALPARVQTLGERVFRQLHAPVRIALVGQPAVNHMALVNGFVGAALVPNLPDLPPTELRFGADPELSVITANGESRTVHDTQVADLDLRNMMMVRVAAPVPFLEKDRKSVV